MMTKTMTKKEAADLEHYMARNRIRDAMATSQRDPQNGFVVYVVVRRRTPSYYVVDVYVPQQDTPRMHWISRWCAQLGIGQMKNGELWVKNAGGLNIETQIGEALFRHLGLTGADRDVIRL